MWCGGVAYYCEVARQDGVGVDGDEELAAVGLFYLVGGHVWCAEEAVLLVERPADVGCG